MSGEFLNVLQGPTDCRDLTRGVGDDGPAAAVAGAYRLPRRCCNRLKLARGERQEV